MTTDRKEFYNRIFKTADEAEQKLIDRLITEVIFYEEQMERLRGLPFITVNPANRTQQKATPASKMYKDIFAQYMNAIRILINVLRKNDTTAADILMDRLQEFM